MKEKKIQNGYRFAFSWIMIADSIVFELKFTGCNPNGRAILALVFTVAVAIRSQALFEGDRTLAIWLSVLPRYRFARPFF